MSTTHVEDDGKVITNQRTLFWLLGLAIACAVAWTTVRATAEGARKRADEVGSAQSIDHDAVVRTDVKVEELKATAARIESKLDRLLDERRDVLRLTTTK